MANKHAAYDLAQMQSLPLEAKILMAKRRIQEWYDYWDGGVYVSRTSDDKGSGICRISGKIRRVHDVSVRKNNRTLCSGKTVDNS